MIKNKLANILIILILCGCGSGKLSAQQNNDDNTLMPADKQATNETVALYKKLHSLKEKGFMIGHQDALAYGVNWKYEDGKSDVKEAVGDYPAVYGWDIGGLELKNDKNLDGVPFKKMKQYIIEGYERGGVITISWHMRSPFGYEKGAWDTTHQTVASILPGGENHQLYKSWLDEAAKFFRSLKGKKGELIPVLFRPFHEHTGNWFWWCKNTRTAFEYASLFRFTMYYLQQEKQLHNLLYVYNTAGNFLNETEFLDGYPGDEWVDMLSFDAYQFNDPEKDNAFEKGTYNQLKIIGALAQQKNKLTALAETGYEAIPYPEWWTKTLLPAIGDNKISYVLLWRNHGMNTWMNPPKMHYYMPYKGQVSQDDFIKFYNLPQTLFEKEVHDEKMYQ